MTPKQKQLFGVEFLFSTINSQPPPNSLNMIFPKRKCSVITTRTDPHQHQNNCLNRHELNQNYLFGKLNVQWYSGPRIDHQKYRSNSVTGVENSWIKQYVFFNKLLKSGPIHAQIMESKCDTPTTRYGQKEMLWHHHKIQLVPINATYSTCTNWNKNTYLQNWFKIST